MHACSQELWCHTATPKYGLYVRESPINTKLCTTSNVPRRCRTWNWPSQLEDPKLQVNQKYHRYYHSLIFTGQYRSGLKRFVTLLTYCKISWIAPKPQYLKKIFEKFTLFYSQTSFLWRKNISEIILTLASISSLLCERSFIVDMSYLAKSPNNIDLEFHTGSSYAS